MGAPIAEQSAATATAVNLRRRQPTRRAARPLFHLESRFARTTTARAGTRLAQAAQARTADGLDFHTLFEAAPGLFLVLRSDGLRYTWWARATIICARR